LNPMDENHAKAKSRQNSSPRAVSEMRPHLATGETGAGSPG